MKRTLVTAVGAVVMLCGLLVESARADEAACLAGLYAAAGKYQSCFDKVASRGFDDGKLATCRARYAAAWDKLQQKNPATTCDGARFVDNGDGTVTDQLTALTWEKKDASDLTANLANRHDVDNTYSWTVAAVDADGTVFSDFLAGLNSSAFAGQRDWRLPSLSATPHAPTAGILPMRLPSLRRSGVLPQRLAGLLDFDDLSQRCNERAVRGVLRGRVEFSRQDSVPSRPCSSWWPMTGRADED